MLLKLLTESSGVSGNEKEVRDLIMDEIRGYSDSIKIDRLGNIIAYKKGLNSSQKLMITAHMDEVGLLITDIDSSGLLKFITVGGIDKRILVSKSVHVGKDKVYGVIGAKPIHLQKKKEWINALDMDDLYIDIGATSKEDAEKYVNIGDYASFQSDYIEFGDNLIKEIKDISFYAVFTVMEEVGLVGAGPAAYEVEPDMAIVLEGTLCYEMPNMDSHLMPTQIGKGPAISLADRTTVYNPQFRKRIEEIAKSNQIPYQYRKSSMGGNDSGKIHTAKTGSITTCISVPCRYIHSPNSVMSIKDYENTQKLLRAILTEYGKGVL